MGRINILQQFLMASLHIGECGGIQGRLFFGLCGEAVELVSQLLVVQSFKYFDGIVVAVLLRHQLCRMDVLHVSDHCSVALLELKDLPFVLVLQLID